MKTLHISVTLFLAFVVFVNANPNNQSMPNEEDAVDACLKKLALTKEEVRELEKSAMSSEEDNGFYCFTACFHKELGLMNAEGNYGREALLEYLPSTMPQKQRTQIVDTCVEQKGTDECGNARLLHDCVKNVWNPARREAKELRKIHDDCKDKLSLTNEQVEEIMRSEDELETNCFGACLMKGVGLLNQDGTFNKDVYIEKSPLNEAAKRLADVCAEEVGADDCETAARILKCLKNNRVIPDKFSDPPPRE